VYKVCFLLSPGEDPFQYRGEKAAAHIHECLNEVKGYVQTRALPSKDQPGFSGVAELWFEHPDAAIAACRDGIEAMLKPGANVQSSFAGLERVVVRTADYGAHATRVKGVYPFCKRSDLTYDQFRHHWWHNHGPIAALTDEALSYYQIHPVAAINESLTMDYDGITEISWPDSAAAGRALVSRQMREDQGTDAPRFVDMDSIALVLAEEEIVLAP